MAVAEASLTRKQIRQVFQQHKGEANALAAKLGCSHVAVSQVLRGKGKSQKIFGAAHERALELMKSGTAAA